MQESYSYVTYTPQSTEHDLENMLNQQEAFAIAELGETTFFSIKEEMEIE